MDKLGNCKGFTTIEFVINWASLGKCKISTFALAQFYNIPLSNDNKYIMSNI
jgi:hypothetical protein